MNYKELLKTYGSPLYLYDFDEISLKYEALKQAFSGRKSLIAYALKANSNLSIIKHLSSLGASCDCVSLGEIKRALKVGVKPYKIIFSGVGKSDEELKEALRLNILFINLESISEYERLEKIAQDLNIQARISVRVNPNIDAKTHPYISTGLLQNKFGVSLEDAKQIYIKAKNSNFIEPVGIHFHIGSQINDLDAIKQAAKIVANLVRNLNSIDIKLKFFDVGGGIGIKYKDEKTIKPYDYAQAILECLYGLDMTIICEPGRFLVASSGEFVTKVVCEKTNQNKRFIVVDGGMNDFLRPALYNAYHEVKLLSDDANVSKADIVGPVCESGDFLAKDVMIAQTKKDDIIIIKNAGAYCFSMSSNYNSRPKVAEIALIDGKIKLIRKKQSFEDLIKDELCEDIS